MHPWRGAPIVDCHDRVFPRKGHHITLIGDLIDFHASGQGPSGHETLHHAAVPELVLDGVGRVRASLFKELVEVVRGRLCLTLAATYDRRGVLCAGAACLLVDVAKVVDHGLLAALLVPLLAALGTLLDIRDNDVRRCSPAAARGWVKLDRLVADSVLGGAATPLLGGVIEGVGRCLERL
jgi:hypothetical protein